MRRKRREIVVTTQDEYDKGQIAALHAFRRTRAKMIDPTEEELYKLYSAIGVLSTARNEREVSHLLANWLSGVDVPIREVVLIKEKDWY